MLSSESSGVVDPAARDKYLLQVTAGPSYDSSTHREVAVNGDDAHVIDNDVMTCYLKVRIRDYHGLPRSSPSTNKYFSHPTHLSDRYSIGFSFVPKKDIAGNDLVTGFDFDHSIKDRLPPGFKYAMKIVTTILDPGIYSDPYSDRPYLYGPALSSFFSFRVGEHESHTPADNQLATQLQKDPAGVIEEGADGSGQQIRQDLSIPPKANKRRKNFLNISNLENFTFEAGRLYQADFFNPYLDFANFALRIPGFSISVVRYIDNKTHQLRYVLKNRRTDEVLFVVIFTLLFGQKLAGTLGKHPEAKEIQKPTVGTPQRHTPEGEPSRPDTSSSCETPVPSSRSSTPASSEVEEIENSGAAATFANSIYSGFAALGFGRTASSSEASSESGSKSTSPERPRKPLASSKTTSLEERKKDINSRIDDLDEVQMEDYLRGRHGNGGVRR
ncbi:DUF1769-domain-containing protein [Lindgomyces ingoldianus]|uniref:DUF1769-domain-containing protein n=1 Tax=Lindgomyces ingoldianus TaxID=673940 RepID=A0ACB6QZM6_9PLEO|nr:DUF1769-domain-containing protein [Lindgomyces ingoldianus]KAF2472439.1 DUF1769-domain-containing protein [Lindgomyces ingoldianus]